MGCLLNSGYKPNTCEDRLGGVEILYLNNFRLSDIIELTEDSLTVELIKDKDDNKLDFYVFEQEMEASVSEGVVNRSDNGSTYVIYTVTIRFENLTEEEALAFNQVLKSRLRIAVKGMNGKTILLGSKRSGKIIGGDIGFGQTFDDLSGGTVQIEFRENKLAPFLDPELLNLIYVTEEELGDGDFSGSDFSDDFLIE